MHEEKDTPKGSPFLFREEKVLRFAQDELKWLPWMFLFYSVITAGLFLFLRLVPSMAWSLLALGEAAFMTWLAIHGWKTRSKWQPARFMFPFVYSVNFSLAHLQKYLFGDERHSYLYLQCFEAVFLCFVFNALLLWILKSRIVKYCQLDKIVPA